MDANRETRAIINWQIDATALQPRTAADRVRAGLGRLPPPVQGQAIRGFNRLVRGVRSAAKAAARRQRRDAAPPPGDAQLIATSNDALARNPADVVALYHKACASARLGRDEEAREVIRLDQQIHVLEPELRVPDAAAFRATVAEEIRRHPSLAYKAEDRATRQGAQTRGLLYPGAPHLATLLSAIRSEIDCLAEKGANDPYLRAAPRRARLSAWAVVYDAGGHQLPHWHRFGWMSGVFYVAGERDAAGRYDGSLLLGPYAEDDRGHNPPWGIREIEPIPGRLVLFPSFTPHRTLPARSRGERICVAFDVVPV